MRTALLAFITLTTTFAATAAEISPYYNPANSASETGVTIGTDLYKTIGCPGRGLLDAGCEVTMIVQPTPVVEAVIYAPVAVVEEKLQEMAPQVEATQSAAAPAASAVNPADACYEKYVKPAAETFQNNWMAIFKTSQVVR